MSDNKDEGHEQESANQLDGESLSNQATTVVAALIWAELSNVVVCVAAWNSPDIWFLSEVKGHKRDEASYNGSQDLEDHSENGKHDIEAEMSFALFPEHAEGNSRIKMTSTDASKYGGHNENSGAYSECYGIRAACPIDTDEKERSSNKLWHENKELVASASWYFHYYF